MTKRLAAGSIFSLFVAACTFGYTVDAKIDGATLTFDAGSGPGFLSPDVAVCELTIIDEAMQQRLPPDRGLGREGQDPTIMWEIEVTAPGSGQGCADYPIRYGVVPAGMRAVVPARPLRRGIKYQIWVANPGVHGMGTFRLKTAVENLIPDE